MAAKDPALLAAFAGRRMKAVHCLTLLLGVAACERRFKDTGLVSPDAVAPSLAAFVARADGSTLNLDSAVAGSWRGVQVLGPGSSASATAPLVAKFQRLVDHLATSDSETLLIFRFQHGLHQGVLIPRSAARFDSRLYGRDIPVDRARFIVDSGRLTLRQ